MALILKGITCAICKNALDTEGELVSTTAFINDPTHPHWSFSDAAMHGECFRRWKHRAEFVALYNEAWGNRTAYPMNPDGTFANMPKERSARHECQP